ncbi:transposase [Thermodesulfovibrionales bacterium]|nr:transposase [Thermodesulfovibrionales bacterium]MCL0051156.1 transposase [Thermodesulfovibrionales bacterium]MCL0051173.1 transposase [Thermodesulfovibrionales bacterium]MCL0068973.1 transposase [Thermodesulfovibrionales bacterium]MCL0096815.1 transposase [Thermodesulfovibrionales bacterium]
MSKAAWTIRRHWQGVLNWHSSRISNGLLEGLNNLFQAAKAKARGYRSVGKKRTVIYLLLGKLQLDLSNPLPV